MENPQDFDPSTSTTKYSGKRNYLTSQLLFKCQSMLSMQCTLRWNGLALQIRRFEMPPLCKLAMWHFCVRRKGHPTCQNIPNLENHTCSSHSHMCTSALISHCAPLKLQILCLPRTCPWDHQIHTHMFSPSFTCLLRPP